MQPAFARHLLDRAFRALGRVRPTGFAFHTLPRKFAADLKDEPIRWWRSSAAGAISRPCCAISARRAGRAPGHGGRGGPGRG